MAVLQIPKKVEANISKLFKPTAYDIRAYVGEVGSFFTGKAVLTPDAMFTAGALMGLCRFKQESGGIAKLNCGDKVVVGYDNGPTSRELAYAFADGLNSAGVHVYMIGIASSGQVYQNQEQLSANGHCQVTRSHVEVTTNGAKFGVGTQGIHTYLLGQMNSAAKNGVELSECEKGSIINKETEARGAYFKKMSDIYRPYFSKRDNSKLCVNVFGGTGVQYIELFRDIFGKDVKILGADIDVNSGSLLADPTRKEMLDKVPGVQELLSAGCRVHSFDLDADRGSVTEGRDALSLNGEGHYLGDSLAFILAEYKVKIALPKLEKKLQALSISQDKIAKILDVAKIIYVDARYTSSVKTYVDTVLKGKTEFHRKGHSLWKETITANMSKMAAIGGFENIKEFVAKTAYRDYQIEASLHLFSTDSVDGIPRDDAVENIFIIEKMIDDMGIVKLSEFFARMPKRFITKEIRTTSVSNEAKDSITYDIIEKLRAQFKDKKGCSIVEFDGQIRIDWATGFIMYGMSNTSPKLTMMAEGEEIEERNEALAYLMALHNESKRQFNDDMPMDLSENPFYAEDKSYQMSAPDEVTSADKRVKKFLTRVG